MCRRQLNSQQSSVALVLLGLAALCVAVVYAWRGARPVPVQAQTEREFRTAITLDGNNGAAHLKLGVLLSQGGREVEAQAQFEMAAHSSDLGVRQAALKALHR